MWKGWYGKEPFDLRLTVLRMLYKLPLILAVTLSGMLVFGGGYYVENVLLSGPPSYAATSVYHVEYAVEKEVDVGTVYINEMSWNTYVHSGVFLDLLRSHLAEAVEETGVLGGTALASECMETDDEELAGMLAAVLGSDLRVPSVTVTADSPEKCVLVARAAEKAMTGEFVRQIREITSISVIDPGDGALEVNPDVRPVRALALSGVLSCFFAVVVLLLKETGDDGIWLPRSLWARYGLKTAGTLESREFGENIRYFFGRDAGGDCLTEERMVLCPVQEGMDVQAVLEKVRQAFGNAGEDGKAGHTGDGIVWTCLPSSPLQCPEVCGTLRDADGILLAVGAGSHAGRQVERVLEMLAQQDCRVRAAVLCGADEKLIRRYYWGNPMKKARKGEDGR